MSSRLTPHGAAVTSRLDRDGLDDGGTLGTKTTDQNFGRQVWVLSQTNGAGPGIALATTLERPAFSDKFPSAAEEWRCPPNPTLMHRDRVNRRLNEIQITA